MKATPTRTGISAVVTAAVMLLFALASGSFAVVAAFQPGAASSSRKFWSTTTKKITMTRSFDNFGLKARARPSIRNNSNDKNNALMVMVRKMSSSSDDDEKEAAMSSSSDDATGTAKAVKVSLEEKMKNWEASEEEVRAATLGGMTMPSRSGDGDATGGERSRSDAFDVGLYIAFPFMIIGSLLFALFPFIMDKIDVSSVGPPPTV